MRPLPERAILFKQFAFVRPEETNIYIYATRSAKIYRLRPSDEFVWRPLGVVDCGRTTYGDGDQRRDAETKRDRQRASEKSVRKKHSKTDDLMAYTQRICTHDDCTVVSARGLHARYIVIPAATKTGLDPRSVVVRSGVRREFRVFLGGSFRFSSVGNAKTARRRSTAAI